MPRGVAKSVEGKPSTSALSVHYKVHVEQFRDGCKGPVCCLHASVAEHARVMDDTDHPRPPRRRPLGNVWLPRIKCASRTHSIVCRGGDDDDERDSERKGKCLSGLISRVEPLRRVKNILVQRCMCACACSCVCACVAECEATYVGKRRSMSKKGGKWSVLGELMVQEHPGETVLAPVRPGKPALCKP